MDRAGPPRWEALRQEDACILVRWCTARHEAADGPYQRREAARALMLALVCAGAPWPDVQRAADAFVDAVLELDDSASPGPSQLADLQECAQVMLAFPGHPRTRAVIDAASALTRVDPWDGIPSDGADEAEDERRAAHAWMRAELQLCLAALAPDQVAIPAVTADSPPGSLVPPAVAGDGPRFGRAVDLMVRAARDRGTRSARTDSDVFHQRVQGYQDAGSAFLWAASRSIAPALGLTPDPPAPDTQVFYVVS
jgi:hypothetical protein